MNKTKKARNDKISKLIKKSNKCIKLLSEGSNYTGPYSGNRPIKHVVLIVVVLAEVEPIIKEYNLKISKKLTQEFIGLARVYDNNHKRKRITVVKVSESNIFPNRHYSGYTQAGALAALVSKVFNNCDIVISFGTAGGNNRLGYKVGDVVVGKGCVFLDRLRTHNDLSFQWGVWAGHTIATDKLVADINRNTKKSSIRVKSGLIGSQIGYKIYELQEKILNEINITCLNMEAGPESQIFSQTRMNFLPVKVISNGIYPKNPQLMESEYIDNRELVSKIGKESIKIIIEKLFKSSVSKLGKYKKLSKKKTDCPFEI